MKHFIVPVLILFFILHFLPSPCLTFQKEKQEEKPDVIIIPDKVKSFFEEGIKTREARLDIPFSIIWHNLIDCPFATNRGLCQGRQIILVFNAALFTAYR